MLPTPRLQLPAALLLPGLIDTGSQWPGESRGQARSALLELEPRATAWPLCIKGTLASCQPLLAPRAFLPNPLAGNSPLLLHLLPLQGPV